MTMSFRRTLYAIGRVGPLALALLTYLFPPTQPPQIHFVVIPQPLGPVVGVQHQPVSSESSQSPKAEDAPPPSTPSTLPGAPAPSVEDPFARVPIPTELEIFRSLDELNDRIADLERHKGLRP
jgi:hypothetical protein